MALSTAYLKAVTRRLRKGEQLSEPFVRCGSMLVDMPVKAQDQAVLRAFFLREQLSLLIGGERVRFRLVQGAVSLTTTIATTTKPVITPTTSAGQGTTTIATTIPFVTLTTDSTTSTIKTTITGAAIIVKP